MESQPTARYVEARDAEQSGQFERARDIYEDILRDLSDTPSDEDRSDVIRDAHFRYAEFHLRWATQPDCLEFQRKRLNQAERDLRFAEGNITDQLAHSKLPPGMRDKLLIEAGAINSLFGRLFTARGAIYIQHKETPASIKNSFEAARLFYNSAERYFSQSYDHHARILNALYAARQERLLGSFLGVRKWLGLVAVELFLERQSYPESARRSKQAVKTAREDRHDYATALASVMLRP